MSFRKKTLMIYVPIDIEIQTTIIYSEKDIYLLIIELLGILYTFVPDYINP